MITKKEVIELVKASSLPNKDIIVADIEKFCLDKNEKANHFDYMDYIQLRFRCLWMVINKENIGRIKHQINHLMINYDLFDYLIQVRSCPRNYVILISNDGKIEADYLVSNEIEENLFLMNWWRQSFHHPKKLLWSTVSVRRSNTLNFEEDAILIKEIIKNFSKKVL